MPLYELYRLAKGKFDPKEMDSACPNDQSSIPENDFFELVWENGEISMQGQSSRAKKIPTCRSLPSHCLPSHCPRSRDKDVGHGTNTKMGKFSDFDSGFNDNPMSVPSGEMDLSQDEDMIHWLNYTIDESLPNEYSSDFLHELSGVTVNELPALNNFSLMDKRSNPNQAFRDTHKSFGRDASSSEHVNFSKAGEVETTRPRASTRQLYPPSLQQCQTSFASIRSRVSDVTENNTSNAPQRAPCGETTQIPFTSSDTPSLKMQKQDPVMPSNSSMIMNFSHFARPAALVRANLQNMGFVSGLSSSARSESMVNRNKNASAATSSNPPESTLFASIEECPKELTMLCQQVVEPSKANLKPVELKHLDHTASASKQCDPVCKEGAFKDDQTSNQGLGESVAEGQAAGEKSAEPAVASSSVCSGNGVERGSGDPNQNGKRKCQDTEDSECHSEDVEEESVGIKKVAHARAGKGSKRSRAAEVHNLSERRRRDRINEKMRALQELIPNCNKVDKASMLDEAIEYLKSLQLQVQIMSMGAGFYMPPMMLPPGMHPWHAPHMASYLPMGVGMQMGLGMGYGMGMPDLNGGSSRFPMMQVPQMQGSQLPIPPILGHNALHGMPRSIPQMFGLPGQGPPLPIPHGPVPFSGGPLVNSSALGPNACGAGIMETVDPASAPACGAGIMETVDLASAPAIKDPMPNVNSQVISTGGSNATNRVSAHAQCEDTNAGFEQSALVHNCSRASDATGSATVNPGEEDNLVTGKPFILAGYN